MIEVLKQQVNSSMPPEEQLNRVREFLQVMALKNLSDQNAFESIAFTGGTALRILYDIRRFSEDLDFSLVGAKTYDFKTLTAGLVRHFKLNNLEVDCKPKVEKTCIALSSSSRHPEGTWAGAFAEQKLSIKLSRLIPIPQGRAAGRNNPEQNLYLQRKSTSTFNSRPNSMPASSENIPRAVTSTTWSGIWAGKSPPTLSC